MFGELLLRRLLHLLPYSGITIYPLNCKVAYFLALNPSMLQKEECYDCKKIKGTKFKWVI